MSCHSLIDPFECGLLCFFIALKCPTFVGHFGTMMGAVWCIASMRESWVTCGSLYQHAFGSLYVMKRHPRTVAYMVAIAFLHSVERFRAARNTFVACVFVVSKVE